MSALRCVFGTSGHQTKGLLKIVNSTICTFRRTSEWMKQMDDWDKNWPLEIQPNSETKVEIIFLTKKSIPFHLDRGDVNYEVRDNAGKFEFVPIFGLEIGWAAGTE